MIKDIRTKQVVSYAWERAHILQRARAGLVQPAAVCDADFLLRAAAQYHGQEVDQPCPLCGELLIQTLWIYGDSLGRRAGSARKASEIVDIAAELRAVGAEFTLHRVEVCQHCRWNHLLESATVY